jgi:hypothetical protein
MSGVNIRKTNLPLDDFYGAQNEFELAENPCLDGRHLVSSEVEREVNLRLKKAT